MPTSTDETLGRAHLRPIERAMLEFVRAGNAEGDIGWRLRRSPGHVRRTLALAKLPREPRPDRHHEPWDLRPIERTVLRTCENGVAESRSRGGGDGGAAAPVPGVHPVGAFADYKLAQASRGVPG